MKIVVTDGCIESGHRNDPCGCPIAIAARHAGFMLAAVETDAIYLYGWANRQAPIPLPPEATSFINDYDEGRPVEPFEFELPVEGP